MGRSIYLINPTCDHPSYYTPEAYVAIGLGPTIPMADLSITTVAALVPAVFQIRLCDENASPIDFGSGSDFVGITGKVSQWGRMKQIAHEFRRRGSTVIIGGPYASLTPDIVAPHCDILVRGEIEEIAPELFADLERGHWKSEYVGSRPDLRTSPVPRWDLYPNELALSGTLQTSRGCPFECEFCDVIEYLGRKQRHKAIDQVLNELDALYRRGYRTVFFADDNFTVYRSRAKELLTAVRDWNRRQTDGLVRFSTQVSIDAARDDELLRMCADAGLVSVFIGIETANEESLRGAKKRQNLKKDLSEEVRRFVEHGIAVDGGMIVGFDEDGPDIFARQYAFAMSAPVPIFTIGALVAPPATPLHARLGAEGRLLDEMAEVAGTPWSTNITPRNITRDQLSAGMEWLCSSVYHPKAFEQRIADFIDTLGTAYTPAESGKGATSGPTRAMELAGIEVLSRIGDLGQQESAMMTNVLEKLRFKPAAVPHVMNSMMMYLQIRHMFNETGLMAC
jgi:radical SAM superfamily enzyme YgiQ (UPF0313 family)